MRWDRIFHVALALAAVAAAGCSLVVPGSRRTADFDGGAGPFDAPSPADAAPDGSDVPPPPDVGMLDVPDPDGGSDAPCTSAMGFRDEDRDTYGTGASTAICLDAGVAIAAVGGDCDDTDPDVHPGALDVDCDGVDTDCDAVLDPDEPSLDAACTWGDCIARGASAACATPADIDGGWEHVCALLDNGALWCWGSDAAGQRDVEGSADDVFVPAITDHTGVIDHCAMDNAHCAITAAGLECWGTASTFMPFSEERTDLVEVACGDVHVCVRTSAGEVLCAGGNGAGQAGVDPATANPVPALNSVIASGATRIAAGSRVSCAIDATDGVSCWGADQGLLGRGTTAMTLDSRPAPVVWSGDPFVEVVIMNFAICARTAGDDVACWGSRPTNLVAENAGAGVLATPTMVTWRSSALGTSRALHHCAIAADSTLACWGTNNTYAFAASPRAAIVSTATPTPAFPRSGPSGLTAIDVAAGSQAAVGYTCAIEAAAAHRIYCWGANTHGQAGAALTTDPVMNAVEVRP